MEYSTNGTNELIYKAEIEYRCRKQTYAYQGISGSEGNIGRLGLTYTHYYM